jgi:hypothetical protein
MTSCSSSSNQEEAIQLAKSWAGRKVIIFGVGGWLSVDHNKKNKKDPPSSSSSSVRTKRSLPKHKATNIVIEAAPETFNDPSAVVFRVAGTQMYLTNILYGDTHRQAAAEALLAAIPDNLVVADTIPLIVDFAIGRPTEDTNFEGSGFNYSPMTVVQPAGLRPSSSSSSSSSTNTRLQLFYLERTEASRRNQTSYFGIKSVFGTYWRSQHWNGTISQSPHCLSDETWYIGTS